MFLVIVSANAPPHMARALHQELSHDMDVQVHG
jgi:hypothetical protein